MNGSPQVQNGFAQVENGSPQVENGSAQVQNEPLQVQIGSPQVQNEPLQVQNGSALGESGSPQVQNRSAQVEIQGLGRAQERGRKGGAETAALGTKSCRGGEKWLHLCSATPTFGGAPCRQRVFRVLPCGNGVCSLFFLYS